MASTRKTPRELPKPKRVLIVISGEHVVGRRILAGVADYTEQRQRWQQYLELNADDQHTPHDQLDGMIIADDIYFRRGYHKRRKLPTVQVTGIHHEKGLPSVTADNHAVGVMGANYLADLGLKHLCFVPLNTLFSHDREKGFAAQCASRGVGFHPIGVRPAEQPRKLEAFIRDLPEPVGIMAATDRLALEVARVCRSIGKRIPDQVALMGVDNETEICRLVDPPLTSIDHGPRRIGYEAARMLDEWLRTGTAPTKSIVVQPISVVTRQSTDLLAIENPDVVRAVRFIRSQFGEGIKVDDVLMHVAMSRRSLEMHFKSLLGRTIHDEILRVRIERAKQLLAATDCSMAAIAAECGFALASQVSFVFKRETGETPQAYRNRHRYTVAPTR